MIPRKQTIRHDPENGAWGDCYRASLASILDLQITDVPHFGEDNPSGDEFHARVDRFLAAKGYAAIHGCFNGDAELAAILGSIAFMNRDIYYLLTGTSKTGCNHTVVCCSDQIVHDPSLTDAGIVGPASDGLYWVAYLTPRFLKRTP